VPTAAKFLGKNLKVGLKKEKRKNKLGYSIFLFIFQALSPLPFWLVSLL
jgi:hypothetical protein